jgi:hypothetical protein
MRVVVAGGSFPSAYEITARLEGDAKDVAALFLCEHTGAEHNRFAGEPKVIAALELNGLTADETKKPCAIDDDQVVPIGAEPGDIAEQLGCRDLLSVVHDGVDFFAGAALESIHLPKQASKILTLERCFPVDVAHRRDDTGERPRKDRRHCCFSIDQELLLQLAHQPMIDPVGVQQKGRDPLVFLNRRKQFLAGTGAEAMAAQVDRVNRRML